MFFGTAKLTTDGRMIYAQSLSGPNKRSFSRDGKYQAECIPIQHMHQRYAIFCPSDELRSCFGSSFPVT